MNNEPQDLPVINEVSKTCVRNVTLVVQPEPIRLGRVTIQRKPRTETERDKTFTGSDVPDDVEAMRTFRSRAVALKLTLMQGYKGSPVHVLVSHGAPTTSYNIGEMVVQIDENASTPIAEFTFTVYSTRDEALRATVRSASKCVLTISTLDFERIYTEMGSTPNGR